MRRCSAFNKLDIDPMSIPSIANREKILDAYADRWFADGFLHETLEDFCSQASADMKDKRAGFDLKAKIRGRGYRRAA